MDSRDKSPEAPPSDEELRLAEELRRAIEDPKRAHADADLLASLKSAEAPNEIDPAAHRAIVERAIDRGLSRRRGRVIRVSFGVTALIAVAAAIVLLVGKIRRPAEDAAALAMARSTQPLFPDRFPDLGGESQRIDRIAMARSSDLRENRFAKWGVR